MGVGAGREKECGGGRERGEGVLSLQVPVAVDCKHIFLMMCSPFQMKMERWFIAGVTKTTVIAHRLRLYSILHSF